MAGKQVYVSAELLESLKQEASTSGVDIDDLIKCKLVGHSPVSGGDNSVSNNQDDLLKAIARLSSRVQNLEIILSRYCILNEAELEDLGYLRGAIEVSVAKKPEVAQSAQNRLEQRSQLARKIREEVEQYLN